MVLLGFFIVAVLFVLSCLMGGGAFESCFHLPGLLCALFPLIGLILTCGARKFTKGLAALTRFPAPNQEVSVCYQKLILYMIAFELGLALFLSVSSLLPVYALEMRKMFLTMALYAYLYTGWIVLLLLMPIAYRFSNGHFEKWLCGNLVLYSVLNIGLLSCILTSTCANQMQVSPVETLKYFASDFGIMVFVDVPSFVLFIVTLTTCRLAMGRFQNRFDWIPICIFIGVLWTLQGMMLMLSVVEVELVVFHAGCLVALLTTVYGFAFALPIIVNRSWFCTVISALFVLYESCVLVIQRPEIPAVDTLTLSVWLLVNACMAGRFCDLLYLYMTRYDTFGALYRKHKIGLIFISIVLLMQFFVLILALIVFLGGGMD
jgi:hypothetical protein